VFVSVLVKLIAFVEHVSLPLKIQPFCNRPREEPRKII
jgi:hypothetical protein